MPRYAAVFFDLGGTLFDYRGAGQGSASVIRDSVGRLGVRVERREIGRAYRKASRASVARFAKQPYYLHRDLFRHTFAGFARELGAEPTEEFLRWTEEAQREAVVRHMAPREDCVPTLSALRQRGVYTSIVSNIDDDYLVPLVERWRLHEVLDHWTSSEEARSCKPDPGFFRVALEKAGRRPDEVLFVGDSPEHDVQGASRAGMDTALIAEEGVVPPLQSQTVEVRPTHTISSLAEIVGLVG